MKRLIILSLLLLVSCHYNEFDDPEPSTDTLPTPNITISEFNALYYDQAVELTREYIFRGYVISSDKAGNFFRTIVLQDEDAGIEIRVGLYELYTKYRVGQEVIVSAQGLVLGASDGLHQLGIKSYDSSWECDYMGHPYIADQYLSVGETNIEITPRLTTVDALSEEWIGTLVQINTLIAESESADTWAVAEETFSGTYAQSGNVKFYTSTLDSIYIQSSGYALFASDSVPRTTINAQGVLMQDVIDGDTHFFLKLRDLDDITVL